MTEERNAIHLTGNVGRDPEMRFYPSGVPTAQFSLAVDDSYEKDGQKVKRTAWYTVEITGPKAELTVNLIHKGDRVHVAGKLKFDKETGGPRIWTDKSGKQRAQFEVFAFNVAQIEKEQAPE